MKAINLFPFGDSALVVQLGNEVDPATHEKVQLLCAYLDEHPPAGMTEYLPAFTNVTIYYDGYQVLQDAGQDSEQLPYELFRERIRRLLEKFERGEQVEARTVEIPVYYGGELGRDLETVARHNSLTPEEVIRIHTEGDYLTYMVGFAPGFPYLGGLSERIATPRRETPRLAIPAGTVGIAGTQTGVYPIETPGGWQLIGHTPVKLFQPEQWPPTLIQAGDRVKFKAISKDEYDQLVKEGAQ